MWLFLLVYMAFETVWETVSDWVFSYTPLLLFSERIHLWLIGQSRWLVLAVYLIHFAAMQSFAVISGKMFIAGNVVSGVVFYVGKGVLAIPTVRFFTMEKSRLLTFSPIRWVYSLVVFIKSSEPYQFIARLAATIKQAIKHSAKKLALKLRQAFYPDQT